LRIAFFLLCIVAVSYPLESLVPISASDLAIYTAYDGYSEAICCGVVARSIKRVLWRRALLS
jgi:hypothetical protein